MQWICPSEISTRIHSRKSGEARRHRRSELSCKLDPGHAIPSVAPASASHVVFPDSGGSEPLKELVLTGWSKTWPKAPQESIFLGPWCFAYNESFSFDSQVRFHLIPSPWKSWSEMRKASEYVDQVVDRLSPDLFSLLIDRNQTDHGPRFWQSLTIFWLNQWVGCCYERYWRLRYAHAYLNESVEVRIVRGSDHRFQGPNDVIHAASYDPKYNLILMSEILRHGAFPKFHLVEEDEGGHSASLLIPKDSPRGFAEQLKERAIRWLRGLAHVSSPRVRIGIIPGMDILDRVYFHLFSRFCPHHMQNAQGGQEDPTLNPEPVKPQMEARNEFESILLQILPGHLPQAFSCVPKKVSAGVPELWIGCDIYYDHLVLNLAQSRSRGGKWFSAQHGGGYGHFLSFPLRKVEMETSDGFISWGWKEEGVQRQQYHPLPSPSMSKLKPHFPRESCHFLYLPNCYPPFPYRFISAMPPESQLSYQNSIMKFFRALSPNSRSQAIFRPYFSDFGKNIRAQIQEILAPAQIQEGGEFMGELRKARLVVIDHLSTTLLQSFSLNIPTILFWEPSFFGLDTRTSAFLKEFHEVGIYRETPEEAAKRVEEVWDHVVEWWWSPSVQDVRKRFCRTFASRSSHWRQEWLKFIRCELSGNPIPF